MRGSLSPGSSVPRRSCAATLPSPYCNGRRNTKGCTCWARRSPGCAISKACLQVAREVKADAYAHGATGKGNDQCRFQLAAEALDPAVKVIAPWRIEKFLHAAFSGRREMIAYCEAKRIPVKASVAKPYSSDENCLHISYEAGQLEELSVNGVELVDFGMTVSPQQAPDKIEEITLGFESGVPTTLDGRPRSAVEMVKDLNRIGGRNGIGRIDMVENRFVGMKRAAAYARGARHDGAVLYAAHAAIEQLTLDRDPDAPPRPARPGLSRDGVLRFLVHGQDGRPARVHPPGPAPRDRPSAAATLQRQHHARQPRKPEQSLRRRHRQHGRRRQLQPDRCRRVFEDSIAAVAGARKSDAEEGVLRDIRAEGGGEMNPSM